MRASANLANALMLSAVARSGEDAVRAVAVAYRQFAHDHPGQYASTLLVPGDVDEALIESQSAIISVIARVLESCGLTGNDAVHHARIVRSAIHGFVALEATDSFTHPHATDDSYALLIEFIVRGLP